MINTNKHWIDSFHKRDIIGNVARLLLLWRLICFFEGDIMGFNDCQHMDSSIFSDSASVLCRPSKPMDSNLWTTRTTLSFINCIGGWSGVDDAFCRLDNTWPVSCFSAFESSGSLPIELKLVRDSFSVPRIFFSETLSKSQFIDVIQGDVHQLELCFCEFYDVVFDNFQQAKRAALDFGPPWPSSGPLWPHLGPLRDVHGTSCGSQRPNLHSIWAPKPAPTTLEGHGPGRGGEENATV